VFYGPSVSVMILASLFAVQLAAQPPATPMERLRAKVRVESVLASSLSSLAGRYTSASSELGKTWGGGFTSGKDLYLFADGTFLYCEWADIEPLTIYDKGTWSTSNGRLTLASEPATPSSLRPEAEYLVVRRPKRADEAILVGLRDRLPASEAEAKDDPVFALLLVGLVREKSFGATEGRRLKNRLMAEARRPDHVGK